MKDLGIYTSRYENGAQNASIAASASETFFSGALDKAACSQWGSFNYLEIVNNSNNDIAVELDGLSSRRRILFARSAMVIKIEEGTYWNNVKLTNLSSTTAITAGDVALQAKIAV